MRLPTLAACAAGALAITLTLPTLRAAAPAPVLTTLSPGGFSDLVHDVNVNIVLVGYENVNQATLLAGLPNVSRPIHRYPDFYGIRQ